MARVHRGRQARLAHPPKAERHPGNSAPRVPVRDSNRQRRSTTNAAPGDRHSTVARDAYIPIRARCRRTRGRTNQRLTSGRRTAAARSKANGIGSYPGWVSSALTHPAPTIVKAAGNPSRKTALTEPRQPAATAQRTREPAATRQTTGQSRHDSQHQSGQSQETPRDRTGLPGM